MSPTKIKKYLIVIVFLQLLFTHINFAYAADTSSVQAKYNYANSGVQKQIETYLCTPTGDAAVGLFACINKLYRFAIAAGSAVGIFFIVIAGYLRMTSDGNQESIDKSKDIFVTTITAMVILFAGYILLKALNPDLLRFESIQPPQFQIVSSSTSWGGLGGVGACATDNCVVGGYNIGSYATDPAHEARVAAIYNQLSSQDFSSADTINQVLHRLVSSTPLTGKMVWDASQATGVDARLIVAIMMQDSSLGTQGKGARTHNPGNVGNDDSGALKDWGTWEAGVRAVADWLNKRRV